MKIDQLETGKKSYGLMNQKLSWLMEMAENVIKD